MPSQGSIGERIRGLRLNRRLSQAQLAGPDLSDSYVSLIESGKRMPTPVVVRLLAERLGCTPEYLLNGVEPRERVDAELGLRHAELELELGNPAKAIERFDHVIETAGDDNPPLVALARLGRCRALEAGGPIAPAINAYEQLRAEAAAHPERIATLTVIVALCRCYRAAGDLMRARELGVAALEQAEQLRLEGGLDALDLAVALLAVDDEVGEAVALPFADRVIAEAQLPRPNLTPAKDLWRVSEHVADAGHPALAIRLADEAIAATTQARVSETLARVRVGRARLALADSDPALAQDLATAAEPALSDVGDRATCRLIQARACLLAGDCRGAVDLVDQALELLGDDPHIQSSVAHLTRGLALLDVPQEATLALESATETLQLLPPTRETARIWREIGDLFGRVGNAASMAAAYRSALLTVGLRAPEPQPVRLRA